MAKLRLFEPIKLTTQPFVGNANDAATGSESVGRCRGFLLKSTRTYSRPVTASKNDTILEDVTEHNNGNNIINETTKLNCRDERGTLKCLTGLVYWYFIFAATFLSLFFSLSFLFFRFFVVAAYKTKRK